MKNYWLDKKKKCNKHWKRFEIKSGYDCFFVLKDEEVTWPRIYNFKTPEVWKIGDKF